MAKTDQDELARQLRACVSAAQCVNVLREQVQREAQVRHRPHEQQGGRELKVVKIVRLFEDLPTGPYLVISLSDGSYKLVDVLQNEVTRVAPLPHSEDGGERGGGGGTLGPMTTRMTIQEEASTPRDRRNQRPTVPSQPIHRSVGRTFAPSICKPRGRRRR